MNIYDFEIINRKGEPISLKEYEGKVLIIVNTATGCGFTPQYEQLEDMYHKYHDKGLEIIDIPCNQFGQQAPGSDEEIHQFCSFKYKTEFEQFKKSDVNGDNQLPLYKYLKEQQGYQGMPDNPMSQFMRGFLSKQDPDYQNNSKIKWNFTKFIINRKGAVVKRFEPTEDMKVVEDYIISLL